MTFTVEQKSQLAKLMATENLTIEHKKILTAKFDPINRVLYLPIWKDMSGALYDLLCGHEVGHALYTPADGWHDAVVDNSKGRGYKSFLNVVEDARIEKKVKRRYPGLKSSFQKAYVELMNRDFFGIKNRDINTFPFIDRLNVYTKSQYSLANIKFSQEEKILVAKVESVETWDDVLAITDEIYEYSKEEQSEMYDYSDQMYQEFNDESEYEESDSFEYDSSEESDEDLNEESDEENDSKNSADSETSEESDEESDEETDSDGNYINRFKESEESFEDQFSPTCETDDNYRSNENTLLDEKCKEYVYIDIPTPKYENILTSASRVHELMDEHFATFAPSSDVVNEFVKDFKNKNEKYISLLVKEFEMRKAAKSFSKVKVADTGDIDFGKLSSYKFDDNIFKKMTIVPKGKKHGLVLLLDKSGSMSSNMSGSIEQILVLSLFCRKVNIPFVVYGFGDANDAYLLDRNTVGYDYEKLIEPCFEKTENSLSVSNVRLREYINSKMSNSEFSRAIKNMILLKNCFEQGYGKRMFHKPPSENLSNTPLTQAIIATAGIMNQFRKKNNLDITNLVIVHDGDADYISSYFAKNKETGKLFNCSFSTYSQNVIIRDQKTKFEQKISNNEDLYPTILNWFKKATHSKVFGFYLTQMPSVKNAIFYNYVLEDGTTFDQYRLSNFEQSDLLMKNLVKKMRVSKFVSSKVNNFDSFFIVLAGKDLAIEEDKIEIEGKYTANKLKTAFMKFNKKKVVNRVLVSEFIKGIAV